MEIMDKNQNLYVLKASTIRHSDIQDLPVTIPIDINNLNLSVIRYCRDKISY